MNFPDKHGTGSDDQAASSDQRTTNTTSDYRQQRTTQPSPTFVLSATSTTTTTPSYWEELSKPLPVAPPRANLQYCSSDQTNRRTVTEFSGVTATTRDPPNTEKTVPSTILAQSEEAFYTVVSLDGTSPTKVPKSYLFDSNPGTKRQSSSCDQLSVYEQQQQLHYALYTESPTTASLPRPSSLPVAKGVVASERKKFTSVDSIAMRDNLFYRLQRLVASQRKPMLNYLIPLCLLTGVMLLIYTFRDTAKSVLFWIETQNTWVIFLIFLCMFTVVSFPVTVGYLVLIIASGYLFGFVRGLLTVMIGANLGVAIAHNTIKSLQSKLPVHKLIKNETGRAILRVISGPRAFKIVLFARLTPIPFGLQNTIFGLFTKRAEDGKSHQLFQLLYLLSNHQISSVNTRSYHAGTVIGLLPAQTINVYLGSKLRSIHEVLNDHNAALGLAGYGVFVVEVIVGAALMVWVIQKARMELSAALLASADADSDEKILIEIEA